jgi:hypothetical protein
MNLMLNPKSYSEEVDMATRALPHAFFAWTWSPVLAGVFASLVVQILLTMLGFGIGLLAIILPPLLPHLPAPAGPRSYGGPYRVLLLPSSAAPSRQPTRPIRAG